MAQQFDLIIIGSGPGGYSTAAKAAAKGNRVAIVERDHLGGTCLNRGCIPTKVICHGAEAGQSYDAVCAHRDEVVGQLREGVAAVLSGVEVFHGNAIFTDAHTVAIEGPDLTELTAPKIIIATGSAPAALPIPGAELAMNSDRLLALDTLPTSLAIIGGGVIGMEFASALNAYGVKITVIEYCPEILPAIDPEIAKRLRMTLKRRGIDIQTGAAVTSIAENPEGGYTVSYEAKGKAKSVNAEAVLMAVGRKAVLPQGLVELGISLTKRGFIETDADFATNLPGVYAIGDVNGRCLLAHAAEAQGKHVLGEKVNLDMIPAVCFTSPAVATAGLTAEQLRGRGIEPREATAIFRSNGYALAIGEPDGLVKIVTDTDGVVKGVHICGPHAADLIAEGALAVAAGLTAADIAATVHAHPTLAETFAHAAEALA